MPPADSSWLILPGPRPDKLSPLPLSITSISWSTTTGMVGPTPMNTGYGCHCQAHIYPQSPADDYGVILVLEPRHPLHRPGAVVLHLLHQAGLSLLETTYSTILLVIYCTVLLLLLYCTIYSVCTYLHALNSHTNMRTVTVYSISFNLCPGLLFTFSLDLIISCSGLSMGMCSIA